VDRNRKAGAAAGALALTGLLVRALRRAHGDCAVGLQQRVAAGAQGRTGDRDVAVLARTGGAQCQAAAGGDGGPERGRAALGLLAVAAT